MVVKCQYDGARVPEVNTMRQQLERRARVDCLMSQITSRKWIGSRYPLAVTGQEEIPSTESQNVGNNHTAESTLTRCVDLTQPTTAQWAM